MKKFLMKNKHIKQKNKNEIKTNEFDAMFDSNEDMTSFLNLKKAILVKRINVDLPKWMLDFLDKEALQLNVSRQAIIKLWLNEKFEKTTQSRISKH